MNKSSFINKRFLSNEIALVNNKTGGPSESSNADSLAIAEIVNLMIGINLKSPQAKANITSIDDNNGKRITL